MFTGIIEAAPPVRSVEALGDGLRVVVPAPRVAGTPPEGSASAALDDGWETHMGDSVAVCGACLTVAALGPDGAMTFDLSRETVERTWFGSLEAGRVVNLERALRLSDRIDGHLVSGHVDGRGTLVALEPAGPAGATYTFELPAELARYVVPKGSVTLDGISLTVVDPEALADGGVRFSVALIPVTLERTHLGRARVGQAVNVEADLLGKWVERLLGQRS